jgi:hypothetical protein
VTEPWTRDEASASGGLRVSRLGGVDRTITRSLHPFLPLTDRGIDGLIHRLTDEAYIPVQAKGRSALMDGEVHLVVWADSLVHDDVVIVSGLIVDGGLGPIIPSEELISIAGRDAYGHLKFEFHPDATTRGRVDAFRRPTSKLPDVIGNLLAT